MKNNTTTSEDELRQLAHLFWQFHNDRLADPELTEMKPYIQPILDMMGVHQKALLQRVIEKLPEQRTDNRPKYSAASLTHGFKPQYIHGVTDGYNQAITEVTNIIREMEKQ